MQTSEQPRSGHVVIGVDTHKHVHVAAVMDTIGGILAGLMIPTDTGGFQQLADWAGSFGNVLVFGIEGTGSYGATSTSFLRTAGHKVVEAGRPDRRLRRMNGKSDTWTPRTPPAPCWPGSQRPRRRPPTARPR